MDRDLDQWKTEIDQDVHLIIHYLKDAEEAENDIETRTRCLALAQKEARRLQSDIYRIGSEVWDIDREKINAVGPL